jgi:hypothetical protein
MTQQPWPKQRKHSSKSCGEILASGALFGKSNTKSILRKTKP